MSGYHKIKLDLTNIPKKNNHFSWINSIGTVVPYQIEGTEYNGLLTILDFKQPNIIILKKDNENKEYSVGVQSFCNEKIFKVLGSICRKYDYNVGDIILNKAIVLEQILITKRDNKTTTDVVGYKLKCLKDNYEYKVEEVLLKESIKRNSVRCPVCNSIVILPDVNSLGALLPGIVPWFDDKSIPYNVGRYSNNTYKVKCPYCGTEKIIRPCTLKKLPSCICKDGFSYPEKMFGIILNQLKIPYIYQLSKKNFKWCGNYKFDFYFEIDKVPYVVELDGGIGHDNICSLNKYNKNNDQIKNEIAKSNGITLIRVDVNYKDILTRFEYIKNNIINVLNNILCFDDINWNEVEYQSEKSIFHKIIDIYNETNELPKDIAYKLDISPCTVYRYLKKGAVLNLCNYNTKESQSKYIQKIKCNDIVHKNFVFLKIEGENFYHVHKTISDFSRNSEAILGFKISMRQIYKYLKNQNIQNAHKLHFSYATQEEYNEYNNYKKAS